MICAQCGKELPDDSRFCLKCGTPIKKRKHIFAVVLLVIVGYAAYSYYSASVTTKISALLPDAGTRTGGKCGSTAIIEGIVSFASERDLNAGVLEPGYVLKDNTDVVRVAPKKDLGLPAVGQRLRVLGRVDCFLVGGISPSVSQVVELSRR